MRCIPKSHITSPYHLIYLEPGVVFLPEEAVSLFNLMGVNKDYKLRNDTWSIIWTRFKNKFEVCFDLADVANQTGLSHETIKGIAKGTSSPHDDFLLFKWKTNPLMGYTRRDLVNAVRGLNAAKGCQ